MAIKLEQVLDSITSLVKCKIADSFIVDTSATGIYFLTDGKEIDLDFAKARKNNIISSDIKHAFRSAEEFLRLLRAYDSIGTAGIVLEELAEKKKVIEVFLRNYSGANKVYRSGNGFEASSLVKKEIDWLRSIIQNESETLKLLSSRVETRDDDLNFLESLVIQTATWSAGYDPNKLNDERIVAAGLYKGFLEDKHVAIITRDHRFKSIISKTQLLLSNKLGSFSELYHFLRKGNLSVILGAKGEGFYVDYCSEEFDPRNFKTAYMQAKPS